MIIAVNARFLLRDQLEGLGYFTQEVVRHLAIQFREHELHLIFDRPYDAGFITAPNIRAHVVGPPARHPLLWKLWYDLKLPMKLKKIRADVFLSMDGCCSLTASIPQVVVVHDLAFLHFPKHYKGRHAAYYKRYQPRFLKKAAAILAVSETTKRDIVENYQFAPEKIKLVHNGVKPVFKPLDFDRQQQLKDLITGGKEFFLYTGSIHPRKNIVNLLKGFSIFKKRLQSSMKLVLAGRMAWKNEEFLSLLKAYKYKDDVLLTGYIPEQKLAELTASCYALVYPSLFEGFGVPVLEGMASGVPVLTSAGTAMEEIAKDAALYFDPQNPADIGELLMQIYKDEDLRSALIARGREVVLQYDWDDTARVIGNTVLEVAAKSNDS